MSVVLGKCPHCGSDVVGGKYGPYCASKCGFTAGKAFGRDLSEEEVMSLLAGEEVLLKGLVSRKDPDNTYEMYVKAIGTEEYSFTKKDGSEDKGYRFKFDMRYPEKDGDKSPAEALGKCPHCGEDVIYGKYGAFCKAKCGFTLSRAFGRDLDKEEIRDILSGKEVLLKGLIHKDDDGNEKKYDMYVTSAGSEEYEYTKKDSTKGKGWRICFDKRFPENVKKTEDMPKEPADEIAPDEIETDIFVDDLPFG